MNDADQKRILGVTILNQWLREEIPNAESDAQESHKAAMNSYGAGYDRSRVDTLKEVQAILEGTDD